MRKIWIGLCIICLGLAVYGGVYDHLTGQFNDDSITVIVFFVLLAGIFGFLTWLWSGKSPVERTVEQAAAVVEDIKEKNEAYEEYSPEIKMRVWKFRIIGALIVAFSIWIWVKGNWNDVPVSIGTVVLIIGIAIFMMGSPEDYNSMTDVGAMIPMDKPRKIEEFYEAYKNVNTPLGSGWLGKFITSPYTSLIFGPDIQGRYVYFWLTGDGNIGYIGYSFIEDFIKERINQPLIPPKKDFGEDTAEYICVNSDVFTFQSWLKDSMNHFIKTGEVLPFEGSDPSEVYVFSEDFKLTGQRFELRDKDENVIYEIEGEMPLINLRIFDNSHTEIFKMTKEIGHALTTYRFYYKGEPYGVLEKQFALVRDKFAMDIKEGRLELIEYAGTIGRNFKVTLNDRMLGTIMENLEFTLHNVVFNNSVIIAYDKEYLPILTAMAVMVARELARDEESS